MNRTTILIIAVLLALAVGFWMGKRSANTTKSEVANTSVTHTANKPATNTREKQRDNAYKDNNQDVSVEKLSAEDVVVPYVKQHGKLPDYYITKSEARRNGWNAGAGNLCDALPGRVIGGDIFTNRQKILPHKNGRTWYEADLNYNCGRRNADRILFSNDGLVYVTHDHYKTVKEQ